MNDKKFSALLEYHNTQDRLFNIYLDSLCYQSGMTWFWSQFLNHEPVILMYHNIGDYEEWIDPRWSMSVDVFTEQMSFLFKHRKVIPLQELIEAMEQQKSLEPGTVVLTFDDGYLSILHKVIPILEQFNFPAAIFLSTHVLDNPKNMWIDELYSLFRYRTKHKIVMKDSDEESFKLNKPENTLYAYMKISKNILEKHSTRDQTVILDEIRAQLQPTHAPPRLLLKWEEIREIKQKHPSIDIGLHSHDHLAFNILSRIETEQQIECCAESYQKNLQQDPKWFAFPYNNTSSYAFEILKKNQFLATFGNSGNRLTPIPNFSRIDAKMPLIQFKWQTFTLHSPRKFFASHIKKMMK